MKRASVSFVLLMSAFVSFVAAQPSLTLRIANGHVWLVARDADVAQVLDAWTRVGGTSFTNAERLAGRQISVELSDVSEAEALDVILRSASGFVAVRREAITAREQSQFSRITIVATSQAPSLATPGAVFQQPPAPLPPPIPIAPGVQRLVGADGQPVPDDQDDTALPSPVVVGVRSIPPGFDTPPQAPKRPAPPRP